MAARHPAVAFLGLALLYSAVGAAQVSPAPLTIPPATIDNTLEITGESVKARQIRTRMFIEVAVDGQGPFRFLVDSGADRSAIGLALAGRLGLPLTGNDVRVQSMAGPSQIATFEIDRLKLGQSEIEHIAAPGLAEASLGADGLLGIDALAEQRLMLDFDKKTVTIQDSRRPEPAAGTDEIVVVARRRKGQLIITQASVDYVRTAAVIDTGAEVTVGNLALRARLLHGRKPSPGQPIVLESVTGRTITADLAILNGVRIGSLTLNNVPVAFADAPPFALFGLHDQPALLLGTDLLEAFRRVSLDFRGRRVRFVVRR